MIRNSSFTCISKYCEIRVYFSENPSLKPRVIVDLLGLSNGISNKYKELSFYGGRHLYALHDFKNILEKFGILGCTLVFFTDCNIQNGKKDEWLRRRNGNFREFADFYEFIHEGISPTQINDYMGRLNALKSTCHGMELIAPMIGEMHYAIKNECDTEIARYAKQHNDVMAIISNDTDYLIYEGSWRLWSGDDMRINPSNELITLEYNKYAIQNLFSLHQKQLPLFATLIGNDTTKAYFSELKQYFERLDRSRDRFMNVACFVHATKKIDLTDADIAVIVSNIFGHSNDEIVNLMRESLDSYKIDSRLVIIDDPVANQLIGTINYSAYMTIMSNIHGISMSYFDMREGEVLPILLMNWMKRKVGIVRSKNGIYDASFTLNLLAKRRLDEPFLAHQEKPIYPECMSHKFVHFSEPQDTNM